MTRTATDGPAIYRPALARLARSLASWIVHVAHHGGVVFVFEGVDLAGVIRQKRQKKARWLRHRQDRVRLFDDDFAVVGVHPKACRVLEREVSHQRPEGDKPEGLVVGKLGERVPVRLGGGVDDPLGR